MKRNVVIAMFVAVLLVSLNAGPIPAARAAGGGCSLASVAGEFGFSYTGVAITPSGPVPDAAVGNYSSDAAGNVVGNEINNLAGTPGYQTIVGKITVKPDCAATLVAKVYQGGQLVRTSYIYLQYDDNTTAVRLIFQKLVLPNGSSLPVVISGDGKKV